MSHVEEALVRRSSGARIVLISLALGAAGILPLLLYVQFGPHDGNPIGLGLLAIAAVPLGGMGILVGLVRWAIERLPAGRP